MIDPTARVHASAKLANDVVVGPWSVVGADVVLGEGTVVGSHCNIQGPSVFGKNNRIYPFCSLGELTQDKKAKGGKTHLVVGDNNNFREFVTVHRATDSGDETRIGSHNHLMNYCHVAHDCILGDHIVMSNNATLAGHVIVKDHVILGGFAAVHQFVQIGEYVYVGAKSAVYMDIIPCVTVAGERARVFGLNNVGLRRNGFDRDAMKVIKQAYGIVFHAGLSKEDALAALVPLAETPIVQKMIDAMRASTRGIAREEKGVVTEA